MVTKEGPTIDGTREVSSYGAPFLPFPTLRRVFSSPFSLAWFFSFPLLPPAGPYSSSLTLLAQELARRFPPGTGDAAERIWGRVETVDGTVLEGFIRWDRNEGNWADILDGLKPSTPVTFQDWFQLAHPEDDTRDRSVEAGGFRITWDDDALDLPSSSQSGIRFGHLNRVEVTDKGVTLSLRSGLVARMEAGTTNLGPGMRELLVEEPGRNPVSLSWEELRAVDFGPAPLTATPLGRRLLGRVVDRKGTEWVGYISWNLDQILDTDTLRGEGWGGEKEIQFGDIASIKRRLMGAEVGLVGGRKITLVDGNDLFEGRQGVLISDPGLGAVLVEWEALDSVVFREPPLPLSEVSYGDIVRLHGTVETESGEKLTGWIKWDADEEYSWEILDGDSEVGVSMDVEFGKIASIEKAGRSRSRVTLLDGRVLDLGGSNEVDDGNKGVLVLEDRSSADPDDPKTEWIRVRWRDLRGVRFHR